MTAQTGLTGRVTEPGAAAVAARTGSMPTYLGMPAFPQAAKAAVADSQLRRNLTHATTTIRAKPDLSGACNSLSWLLATCPAGASQAGADFSAHRRRSR